ncbi:hypothetical protein [Oceanicella actignis]|uniref:Putative transposase n=1 Tax=Oceanicella actignis TaxID=1189325 RepID=A0A1M7ST19_9RHOB|nr:hypothetical protein [Oceanicella actignis]TYO90732.1 putative transposase [Oceanicella actignis]SES69287.1 putative transposase [Oceanicella actignis]SHN61558.1 putative transposase [Oceanicella actignis]
MSTPFAICPDPAPLPAHAACTLRLLDRRSDLLVREVAALRAACAAVKRRRPFQILGAVVLPAELRLVIRAPDHDLQARLSAIKAGFMRALPPEEKRRSILLRRKDVGVWMRGAVIRPLADGRALREEIEACWRAPVRAGLAADPSQWPFSSYRRDASARAA